MEHYIFMRNQAAYQDRSNDPERECRQCDNYTDKNAWKRCDKGGFFVKPGGTCKNFEPASVGASS